VDAQHEPQWKDAEKNSLLGLRKEFQLAVNVRPAKVWPLLADLSPLKPEIINAGVDMVIGLPCRGIQVFHSRSFL
jgi:3-isopropylmalate dehydrogenase